MCKNLTIGFGLIFILFSCNNCEEMSDNEKADFLERYNTDFSLVVGSQTYDSLIRQNGILYETTVDDLGKSNSMILIDFDSLHYNSDSLNTYVDYYHHSYGCDEFIPVIEANSDTIFVKCLVLTRAQIKCIDGSPKIAFKVYSCSNIMKWHVQIKKAMLNKVLVFQPYKDKLEILLIQTPLDR